MSVKIASLVSVAAEAAGHENRFWEAMQTVAQPWVATGAIKLFSVTVQTEERLIRALADECDVLHLIACGKGRGTAHYATVLLKSSEGQARAFTAQAFGRLLTGYPALKLVVLQAADADTKSLEAFGAVLIETGIPAVIVTPFLQGRPQDSFLAQLYTGLADRHPLSQIVENSRTSLALYGFDPEAILLLGTTSAEPLISSHPNVERASVYAVDNTKVVKREESAHVSAPTVFFSYSHVDEALRDRLEVQLSSLKRLQLIAAWHDRLITAGADFGQVIDETLESSQIILLLVSPDFIASDYCYEREMSRALEKHARGEAHVLPIILRPCDWRELPFGKLLAAPRDGKPVTSWSNLDEAFLDVTRSIRGLLKKG